MKRIGIVAVALVLAFATTAFAAAAMKVAINGKEIAFKTAPRFEGNALMVPLEEVVSALGMEARWNVGTNTLEVTDARAQRIAELEARVKELEGKAKEDIPAKPGAITKENLVAKLQEQFGVFKRGTTEVRFNWRKNPYSDESSPLFAAEVEEDDALKFFPVSNSPELKAWFHKAGELIAQAYKTKATAVLVYYDVYSFYPTANYDDVRLTSDYKWAVTEYYIWTRVSDGVVDTDWDDD